ncbi:hypothetical protein Pelo_15493 [Pelomyxa schiedti]|nr:hypothetical protein Pelo_15493 [Pelomyxa schiedti]
MAKCYSDDLVDYIYVNGSARSTSASGAPRRLCAPAKPENAPVTKTPIRRSQHAPTLSCKIIAKQLPEQFSQLSLSPVLHDVQLSESEQVPSSTSENAFASALCTSSGDVQMITETESVAERAKIKSNYNQTEIVDEERDHTEHYPFFLEGDPIWAEPIQWPLLPKPDTYGHNGIPVCVLDFLEEEEKNTPKKTPPELPLDIWGKILLALSRQDFYMARQTNRRVYRASEIVVRSLWEEVTFSLNEKATRDFILLHKWDLNHIMPVIKANHLEVSLANNCLVLLKELSLMNGVHAKNFTVHCYKVQNKAIVDDPTSVETRAALDQTLRQGIPSANRRHSIATLNFRSVTRSVFALIYPYIVSPAFTVDYPRVNCVNVFWTRDTVDPESVEEFGGVLPFALVHHH